MRLKEDLLRGIYAYGFERPSAIQQRAIVPIIQGRDVIAQSQVILNNYSQLYFRYFLKYITSLEPERLLFFLLEYSNAWILLPMKRRH
jgi:hypothetical protein